MAGGIHHVTLITRKVQANVDFYAGVLGLRLVKRTGGYEDAMQLHVLGMHRARQGRSSHFLYGKTDLPAALVTVNLARSPS